MKFIINLMLISRTGIVLYGLTANYLTWSNEQFACFFSMNNLLHCIEFKSKYFFSATEMSLTLWALTILMLILSKIIFRKLKNSNLELLQSKFKLPKLYSSIINHRRTDTHIYDAYEFKDIQLLNRQINDMKKNPLGLFFTNELFLIMGSIAAILPTIHNLYIIMLMFLINSYLVVVASLRTLCDYFPDIFKFESDARSCLILNLTNHVKSSNVLFSKHALLKYAACPLCIFALTILYIFFAIYIKFASAILLIDCIIIAILYDNIIKWILHTDYDVFCILVKNREVMNIASISDYTGYDLISTINRTSNMFFMYGMILSLLVCSFLILVSGWKWVIPFCSTIAVLTCNSYINVRYYNMEVKNTL